MCPGRATRHSFFVAAATCQHVGLLVMSTALDGTAPRVIDRTRESRVESISNNRQDQSTDDNKISYICVQAPSQH